MRLNAREDHGLLFGPLPYHLRNASFAVTLEFQLGVFVTKEEFIFSCRGENPEKRVVSPMRRELAIANHKA